MLRQVFCEGQGATLAFITTVTMLADWLTKSMADHAYATFLAALTARAYTFVASRSGTGIRTTMVDKQATAKAPLAVTALRVRSRAATDGSGGGPGTDT